LYKAIYKVLTVFKCGENNTYNLLTTFLITEVRFVFCRSSVKNKKEDKVITSRKPFIILVGLLLAVQVFFVSTVAAQEGTVDSETVERLERLIKEQQQQLESLQQQMNQLKQTATEAQTQAKEAKSVAEEAKTTVQAPVKKVVTSGGGERIKLAISGQVNSSTATPATLGSALSASPRQPTI
jgi:septal ring factor EnvC (AmiA/AmiB activator)